MLSAWKFQLRQPCSFATWDTADRRGLFSQLLGRVKVTLSDRGLISEQVHRNLLKSATVLSCPPRDVFTPTEECLPFVIPFPSHVAGGTSPLPPSYVSWSPTFTTEVEYCVRVDVHRKGLRRHELYVLLCHTFAFDPVSLGGLSL